MKLFVIFLASSVTLPSTTRTVMGVSGLWETKNGDGSTVRIAYLGASVVLGLAWLRMVIRVVGSTVCRVCNKLDINNDLLLHRYIVNYIARNFNSISIYDFFLPLNTGFPLLSHYQHLPHVIVGTLRYAWQQNYFFMQLFVSLEPSADTACLWLLVTMPISIYYGASEAGFSKIAAFFMALIWPVLNDRPPPQNRQQGVQYSYGIGINSQLHNGHGLWSQVLAAFVFFQLWCRIKPFAAY